MRLLPYGRDAVLAEVSDPASVLALRDAALGMPGVLDAVAGAQTVLVEFDLGLTSFAAIRAGLQSAPLEQPTSRATAALVELPVDYSGPDLANVARLTGLTEAEVVRVHIGASYVVQFCGFAPGFAYLTGLDPVLHVARHASPRTDVPAGSVAIAGHFSAVYPRRGPGGWQLLGRITDSAEPLWDARAAVPTRLSPGTQVRFVVA